MAACAAQQPACSCSLAAHLAALAARSVHGVHALWQHAVRNAGQPNLTLVLLCLQAGVAVRCAAAAFCQLPVSLGTCSSVTGLQATQAAQGALQASALTAAFSQGLGRRLWGPCGERIPDLASELAGPDPLGTKVVAPSTTLAHVQHRRASGQGPPAEGEQEQLPASPCTSSSAPPRAGTAARPRPGAALPRTGARQKSLGACRAPRRCPARPASRWRRQSCGPAQPPCTARLYQRQPAPPLDWQQQSCWFWWAKARGSLAPRVVVAGALHGQSVLVAGPHPKLPCCTRRQLPCKPTECQVTCDPEARTAPAEHSMPAACVQRGTQGALSSCVHLNRGPVPEGPMAMLHTWGAGLLREAGEAMVRVAV